MARREKTHFPEPRGQVAYLTRNMARGFMKQALSEGLIKLREPETENERFELKEYLTSVNRARCEKSVLWFALSHHRVIVEHSLRPRISKHPIDVEASVEVSLATNPSRDFVASTEPDIQDLFGFARNVAPVEYIPDLIHGHSDEELGSIATLLAMLEPLILGMMPPSARPASSALIDSFLRDQDIFRAISLYRSAMNDACGVAALETDESRSDVLLEELIQKAEAKYVQPMMQKALLPLRRQQRNLRKFDAWKLYDIADSVLTRALWANHDLKTANIYGAHIPVVGLPKGRSRSLNEFGNLRSMPHDEVSASTWLFLDAIEFVPRIEKMSDVLRLRKKPAFGRFQGVLGQWLEALRAGDKKSLEKLRQDLVLANRDLRRAATCRRVGGYLLNLSLPLMILDALVFPVFGASATVCGFALKAREATLENRSAWLALARGK